MKNFKLCALLASILCAAALTACTGDAPDTDTTAPITTEAPAEETTEPAAEEATDAETITEAVTAPEETTEAETECHILFEDDFTGSTLDATKWKVGTEEDQPTVRHNVALWDASMVALDGDGHLVLTSEWDTQVKAARSGAVITKGLFEAGYGYYEASIQFPLIYGRSNHFSIVTEKTNIDVLRSENGLQEVIYEHRLSQGDTVQSLDALRTAYVNIYDGRFHTFGVLRSAEGHTFYIDGQQTGFIPTAELDASSESGYLALFWEALKTDGAGRGDEGKTNLPAKMIIDCVRVYSSLPESFGVAENTEAELMFDDDFNGTELDNTKWERCPEAWRAGMSYWEQDMSYVDGDGNLVLRMEWNETNNVVDCGAVRTLGRFEYGYGYYESRMRFTEHYGVWGAFWMMCGDLWSDSAAGGVEIDILETIDNQNGIYNHALHSNYNALNSLGPTLLFNADLYNGEYHTVGLLRAENGYFFYIDGKLSAIVPHYKYTPCPLTGYIKLTCESAAWSGGGTEECIADMPAEMVVDYVRVWNSVPTTK